MKAIILGSGADELLLEGADEKTISTRYGEVYYLQKGDMIYLPRHKKGHSVAPHKVNYQANVWALKELGVDRVISLYAVGSISSRFYPGSYGLVKDFLDFTSNRANTFFDGVDNPLKHTAMVNIFDKQLSLAFLKAAGDALSFRGVYVCTNGPRLETPSEIRAYRTLGGDMVGMTLATEITLLRELDIRCAAVAYSINWAAGLDEEGISFLEDESIKRLCTKALKASEAALNQSI